MSLDDKSVIKIAREFKIESLYQYLPLVLLFRTNATKKLGTKIKKAELRQMVKKEVFGVEKIYELLTKFPDDFLLILRTNNLIAIRNIMLGGDHRFRLLKMTKTAYQSRYSNHIQFYWNYFLFNVKLFMYEQMT